MNDEDPRSQPVKGMKFDRAPREVDRLRRWMTHDSVRDRWWTPVYANPTELLADVAALLDLLAAVERRLDRFADGHEDALLTVGLIAKDLGVFRSGLEG